MAPLEKVVYFQFKLIVFAVGLSESILGAKCRGVLQVSIKIKMREKWV